MIESPPQRKSGTTHIERARRPGLRSALADAGSVIVTTTRLLVRHWPVLFALAFAAEAAHDAVLYGAVRATEVSGLLGYLTIVLVPVTTLTAIVLMLRAVRASLPETSAVAVETAGSNRPRRLLDHTGSLLIPFLTAYSVSGYIGADMLEYGSAVTEAATQEIVGAVLTDPLGPVPYRELFPQVPALIAVVVLTFGLRWLQSRWEGTHRRPWLGIVAAYLEVVWITSVILMIASLEPWRWVAQRRIVDWALGTWNGAVATLGPVAEPTHVGTRWVGDVLGSADAVLGAPIAWLMVGVVAFGYQLTPMSSPMRALHDQPLYQRVARGWAAIPALPRRGILWLTNDVRDRFGPMISGLRLFSRVGLPAMLLFCLAIVVVRRSTTRDWGGAAVVLDLLRLLVGPQDLATVWAPLITVLSQPINALIMVLFVCVLAAAVERVLLAHRAGATGIAPVADGSAPGDGSTTKTSPGGEPGIPRQPVAENDPHRDGLRGAGRHEVGDGLVR